MTLATTSRWVLAACLLLAMGPRCPWPETTYRILHTRDACSVGDTYLDWVGGRTLVQLGDCVELPDFYAAKATACCGELCSGPAELCTEPFTCERTLDYFGNVLRDTPETHCE
jgi:hypothetical protein